MRGGTWVPKRGRRDELSLTLVNRVSGSFGHGTGPFGISQRTTPLKRDSETRFSELEPVRNVSDLPDQMGVRNGVDV